MKSTRKQFKYELRWCKKLKDQKSADALAKAFHSNTSHKAFWQNVKKLKKSSPLPAEVEGASGSQKIAKTWKNHFSNLLNSVGNNEYKEFVYNNITCKNSYINSSQYMCDINTIQSLMCKLPFDSVVGSDDISTEHICFADSTVALYLSLFFDMCILHGYIPKPCIHSIIVPILKNKNGNHQDCGNCRPIAIATVVSKLFEQVILINIKNFLDTTENQFAFKTKHSTDRCVFTSNSW